MTLFESSWEKKLVINNRELKYSGIFKVEELFSVINKALEERGYEKREKRSEEEVTEESKNIYLELRPYKMKTNYLALMIKLKIDLHNVVEILEHQADKAQKFQSGNIVVFFDAWVLTDHEARWGMKPLAYFIKGFINKFLYTYPLEGKAKGEVQADTAYIYGLVKKLLQSYGGEKENILSEEEIRRKAEEEMGTEMEGAE